MQEPRNPSPHETIESESSSEDKERQQAKQDSSISVSEFGISTVSSLLRPVKPSRPTETSVEERISSVIDS
jgi:hypothetical protein